VAQPWATVPGGLEVTLRLTPRGGRDAFDGVATLADGRTVLKARVRAVAEAGAANAALRKLLAATLGAPPSAVTQKTGHAARLKTFFIAGQGEALAAALEAALAMTENRP
jgi:uncharacterized protein